MRVLVVLLASGESRRFLDSFGGETCAETCGDSKTSGADSKRIYNFGLDSRIHGAGGIKKQWIRIERKPLWKLLCERFERVLKRFGAEFEIVVTASPSDYFYMKRISKYPVVLGGSERQESLLNALEGARDSNFDVVLAHDCARFMVADSLILELLGRTECIKSGEFANITPYASVSDTALSGENYIDRKSLKLIQTPQISGFGALLAALRDATKIGKIYTDESSLLSATGHKIAYIKNATPNEKLTFFSDLNGRLEKSPAVLVGNGFDTHAFETNTNKKMMLCGVEVACEKDGAKYAFKAHSDGDVALHALSDAILGAMNAGDIGEWFPDTDSAYAGADSAHLLAKIYNYAKSVGFCLLNADITILAQMPKISPHKEAMRARVAEILGIDVCQISIKATTMENLGFIGRSEGACAMATVTLQTFELV